MATVQTTASVADINKITGLQSTAAQIDAKVGEVLYTHPLSHPASIIEQDLNNRFVTDTEKSTWNGKAETTAVTTLANGLMIASDKTKLDAISGTNTGVQYLNAYAITANVHSVNSGGTAGQVLAKIDSTDFNTQWVSQKEFLTYKSGKLYSELFTGTYIGISSPASTTLQGTYIVVHSDVTINLLTTKRYSYNAPGGDMIMGIYNVDSNNVPTTLIAKTVVATVTTIANYLLSMPDTFLAKGTYAIVISQSFGIGNFEGGLLLNSTWLRGESPTISAYLNGYQGFTAPYTYNADLPASLSSATLTLQAGTCPVFMFGVK